MAATPEKARRRWSRVTPDRVVVALLALEGFLLLSAWFRWFPFNQHKGWTVLICLATVGAAFVLMFLWFLAALVFRRRFQFSILSLLVLMVVVAVPFSWLATEMKAAREQREIVHRILGFEDNIAYDYQAGLPTAIIKRPAPAWLCRLLGDDFFGNVQKVTVEYGGHAPRPPFDDAAAENLQGLTQLQTLDLNNTEVTDAGLKYLKGLAQLQTLSLYKTEVTDTGLVYLRGLSQLQTLNLSCYEVTDSGLKHIEGLTKLQTLSLEHTKVTDAGLAHLKRLSDLRSLNLKGTKVTDAGLKDLKGFSKLQSLNLLFDRVTGAGLEHLKGLTSLETLSLGCAEVTDAGLRHLKRLTKLKRLNLQDTQVTDAGLEYLKELTHLQFLDLNGTNVTDAGLEHLKGLTNLQELDIVKWHTRGDWPYQRQGNVTDAGVKKLQQALPTCKIIR